MSKQKKKELVAQRPKRYHDDRVKAIRSGIGQTLFD